MAGFNVYSETLNEDSSDYGVQRFEGWHPNRDAAEREVKAIQDGGDAAYLIEDE